MAYTRDTIICFGLAISFSLWALKPAWRSNWFMRYLGWNCPTEAAARRNAVVCVLLGLFVLFHLDRFTSADIVLMAGMLLWLILHLRDAITTNIDSPEFKRLHGLDPSPRP